MKNLKTGAELNEPQPLPENWASIFGMSGIADRLGNLDWLGPDYVDQGWVVVGEAPEPVEPVGPTAAEIAVEQAQAELRDSTWTMLDDAPLTVEQKAAWVEYRRALRDIENQPGFPDAVQWPVRPE